MTKAQTTNGRTTPRKKPIVVSGPIPETPATNGNKRAVPEGTLRLLKVRVQPVYALDTPDGLIVIESVPVEEINGAGWVEWAAKRFTPANLEVTCSGLQILEDQ